MDVIRTSRKLRWIPRFSTFPLVRPYSVAEHSHAVAVIAGEVYQALLDQEGAGFSKDVSRGDVLQYALHHDTHEGVMGDILYQNKRANEDLEREISRLEHDLDSQIVPTVTRNVRDIVYLADILELYMYVQEEKELGNSNIELESCGILAAVHSINRLEGLGLGDSPFRRKYLPSDREVNMLASVFATRKNLGPFPTGTNPKVVSKTVIHRKDFSEDAVREFERAHPGYLWGATAFYRLQLVWMFARVNRHSQVEFNRIITDVENA